MAGHWYEKEDYPQTYKIIKRKRSLLRLLSFVQNPDRMLEKAVRQNATGNVSLFLLRRTLGDELFLTVPARALAMTLDRRHDIPGGIEQMQGHFVLDGDWTKTCYSTIRSSFFNEAKALLEHGSNIKESKWYGQVVAKMRKGLYLQRHRRAIRTVDELDDYLGAYAILLESIRKNGVLKRSSLSDEEKMAHHVNIRSRGSERKEVDLGIAIDGNSKVYRVADGHHRSAMALLLGLPAIPVELRVVHRDWLRTVLTKYPQSSPTKALCSAIKEFEAGLRG